MSYFEGAAKALRADCNENLILYRTKITLRRKKCHNCGCLSQAPRMSHFVHNVFHRSIQWKCLSNAHLLWPLRDKHSCLCVVTGKMKVYTSLLTIAPHSCINVHSQTDNMDWAALASLQCLCPLSRVMPCVRLRSFRFDQIWDISNLKWTRCPRLTKQWTRADEACPFSAVIGIRNLSFCSRPCWASNGRATLSATSKKIAKFMFLSRIIFRSKSNTRDTASLVGKRFQLLQRIEEVFFFKEENSN